MNFEIKNMTFVLFLFGLCINICLSEFCYNFFLVSNDFCYDFDGLELIILYEERMKFKNY